MDTTSNAPALPAYYGAPINTPTGHKWAGYTNPSFERLLDLEHQTQVTKNVAGFIVGDGKAALERVQGKLFAELAKLTPVEQAAFGEYRKAHR